MSNFIFGVVSEYLNQLNGSQKAAVCYTDGPSLVIAGAGSGKTRVLTYKIAYLIEKGIHPSAILALTFTNKAAREMKDRISSIVGHELAKRLWMGTFHSIFSRILRAECEVLGFPRDFTIYDAADTKSLLKTIIKERQLDEKVYKPNVVYARISNAKNALITPQAYAANKDLIESDMYAKMPLIKEIYQTYFNRCKQAGAMDFDDLLLYTNILFRDNPSVLEKYRTHFQYILVDEYQDTNFAQHLIVQRLAEQHRNICVVGDDAQSIYSFRGANIDNILTFKNNFPHCKIFKLEQNYRSTQTIVDAANSLIQKNSRQIEKKVFSENEVGHKIEVLNGYSDYEEGYLVANKISEVRMRDHDGFNSFAILYRTNAQSRIFEEALRKRNIPYRIYGGLSFYQRKEIKDVISYFRLCVNPTDEEALKRVINYPTRGIGDTTLNKVLTTASLHNESAWNVICDPLKYALPVNAGTASKLKAFKELIVGFIEESKVLSASDLATLVVKQSGIVADLFQDRSVEGTSKQENLQELLKGIAEFCEIKREEGVENPGLSDFLAEVSLLTDQDNTSEDREDKVTLMTIHAAKGLEFRNVFVVGLEEDLFPSGMSKGNDRAIEEERRLFYVAITRAERLCFITYAKSRFRNGQSNICSPSRFIRDIDPRYLNLPADDFGSLGMQKARESAASGSSQQKQSRRTLVDRQPLEVPIEHKPNFKKVDQTVDNKLITPEIKGLRPGNRIMHERFGEGRVLAIAGEGTNMKATVEFQSFGQKQLLLKFAKFTIVE